MANTLAVSRRLRRSSAYDFEGVAPQKPSFVDRVQRRTPISGGNEEPTLRLAEAVQGGGGIAAPIRLRNPPYAPQRLVRCTDRDGGIQREAGALEVQLISRMSVHGGLRRLGGCRTLRSDRGSAWRK